MSQIDQNALGTLLLAGNNNETVYVPNSGNAGDSLIAEATYQFLDDISLRYTTAKLTDTLPGRRRVIVGGGGNLVGPYRNVRNFLDRNLDLFDELIILPHTIQAHEDVLAKLDERCTLICREQRSFDFTRAAAPRAKVLLGDDMALLWNPEKTRTRAHKAMMSHIADPAFDLRNLKHTVRRVLHRGKVQGGTLNAFRLDVESRNSSVPEGNIDLSQVFATDSMSPAHSACAIHALAQFIDRADIVRSDRLHISILSAALGKKVEMHDNNYGKNRSVYDHSLASRFPNITFVS